MRVKHGSNNFVSLKGRSALTIVLTYQNKWLAWKSYWFYLQVYWGKDVTTTMTNNLQKAYVLVLKTSPMTKVWSVDSLVSKDEDLVATKALALIAYHQISWDLVEEWVAHD